MSFYHKKAGELLVLKLGVSKIGSGPDALFKV
jgi:hypothetical protein